MASIQIGVFCPVESCRSVCTRGFFSHIDGDYAVFLIECYGDNNMTLQHVSTAKYKIQKEIIINELSFENPEPKIKYCHTRRIPLKDPRFVKTDEEEKEFQKDKKHLTKKIGEHG